jgi:hypothetical protein
MMYWQQQRFDRTVSEHSVALAGLLDAGSLAEAESYYERLERRVQIAPAI